MWLLILCILKDYFYSIFHWPNKIYFCFSCHLIFMKNVVLDTERWVLNTKKTWFLPSWILYLFRKIFFIVKYAYKISSQWFSGFWSGQIRYLPELSRTTTQKALSNYHVLKPLPAKANKSDLKDLKLRKVIKTGMLSSVFYFKQI